MDRYEAIKRHADTLCKELEDHRRLLEQAGHENERPLDFCPDLRCPHEQQLREAVRDVVDTLEETRKSFKSKQLERLRRRMLEVLYSTDSDKTETEPELNHAP